MKPAENEQLRRACLEVLAARVPTALQLTAVRRRVVTEALVDFPFDDAALVAALNFLQGFQLVASTVDDFGTTTYWRATSKGVLAFERGTMGE